MICFEYQDFINESENYFIENNVYSRAGYKEYIAHALKVSMAELNRWINNNTFPERIEKFKKYAAMAEGNVYITLNDALSSIPMDEPATYLTAKCLQDRVAEYFDTHTNPTIAGLAKYIGTTRATLLRLHDPAIPLDISKRYCETAKVLIEAMARCEEHLEEVLITKKNVQGTIFALKNNFGWRDKIEQEVTVKDETVAQICDEAWNRIKTINLSPTEYSQQNNQS